MKEMKITVCLNFNQLYRFNLYHCYHSFNGTFSIILGVVCIAYALVFYNRIVPARAILLIVLGLIFWIYNPISLYMRSKSRFMTNDVLGEPMDYCFTHSGISLSQKEVTEEIKWESIYKIQETKESLLVYITSRHANIIPKESIGEQYAQVCEYIRTYATNSIVKIKG